ncbi:synaptosomal-associated protein 29 [Fopius arisanus]|uniref:Snap29 protein n=1 Tax=Fopius arisanus TaxID=64838 RepID=A0A0C9RI77_9HYME|nr:PREDICTED: synaptosomal-associated protein 29 [Fopius arisanus]
MSDHNYSEDSNNPFFSLEDDVDDEDFLRSGPSPPNMSSSNSFMNFNYNIERQHQQLIERRKAIEDKTIKSSERSISLLRDSEQIGAATAEELIRQREQLERTEKRLDDINSTLRFSQKHIQGIKSVFGSLKNYLSGKSLDSPVPSTNATEFKAAESSRLAPIVEQTRSNLAANHPSLYHCGLLDGGPDEPVTDNVSKILERNLEEMGGSLARLKGLAIGLTEEIDSQSTLIDNVADKTERADIMIGKQNKDMRHLLKK